MAGARPADPQRRARTLAAATDYVLEHGLDELSLRPLAAALDTSPRMLLYDFGSKEELVAELVASVRDRLTALVTGAVGSGATNREAVERMWGWLTDPEHAGYVRLHAQLALHAASVSATRGDDERSVNGDRSPGDDRAPGAARRVAALEEATGATRTDVILIDGLLHALALRRLGSPRDATAIDAAAARFMQLVRDG